jgi:hypothetical protein
MQEERNCSGDRSQWIIRSHIERKKEKLHFKINLPVRKHMQFEIETDSPSALASDNIRQQRTSSKG